MNRIVTLIGKEWADVFHNRYVITLIIILPLIMTGLPILTLGLGLNADMISGMSSKVPPQIMQREPYASMSEDEAMQVFLGQQFNLFFMILPLAIPMTIATYSIVGEKRDRSLEPLLATPISTVELLAAKSLAAAGPGLVTVWGAGMLYTLAIRFMLPGQVVRDAILSPAFYLMILLITPLLTILATTIGLMVSSRVNDPRTAEQMGLIVLLPILGLLFAQIAGVITFDISVALLVAGVLAVADVILLQFAARLFSRETILTRWK